MDELDNAIKKFVETCASHSVRGSYGKSTVEWPKELPKSKEVEHYFQSFNPSNSEVESGMTPTEFFNLSNLLKGQIGYRWRDLGTSLERLPNWPDSYLVIADVFGGGKPIIAVTNIENTPIFAGYDVITPFKIADSMAQFFTAMSLLTEIVYGKYDIFEVSDDDGVKPEFAAEIAGALIPVLGLQNYERFFDYFYG
jgi:hypothetical protein